uniref:FAR1 domain-containing protein n=1 Tax=Lactuca sativa TaxID=4236 RepID=A0A9R1VWY7_LACSA|nr:hypothetical protein LSAT_V11C300128900 [Lactuca sativa]
MSKVLHDIKPDVPDEFKPTKEMRFKDVDEGVNFYRRYAEKASFGLRLNTLRKVDCRAKIIVKRVKGRVSIGLISFKKITTTSLKTHFT